MLPRFLAAALLLGPCIPHTVSAERFDPVPMTISAPNWMNYEFDGTQLSIPVTVSGTPGMGVMLIFTSGEASNIHKVRNGNLGWHYVDGIDTCLYVSPTIQFSLGANTVTWNGKDEDGNMVPAGEYSYYLWAYNSSGSQSVAVGYNGPGPVVITHDENGNPLSSPEIYSGTYTDTGYALSKHYFGDDSILSEKTTLPYGEYFGEFTFNPKDHSFFYNQSKRSDGMFVMRKWQWVPSGNALLQTDWAQNGESAIPTAMNSQVTFHYSGPVSDTGDNLFFTNIWSAEDGTRIGFMRMDIFTGKILRTFDMTSKWSDLQGENTVRYSSGMLFFNTRSLNLAQMIDPYGEEDFDPVRWETDFEKETSIYYSWNIFPDRQSISLVPTVMNNCFELLAPDGTRAGYFPRYQESTLFDRETLEQVIDTDTPFDGLYFVNTSWHEYIGNSYRASDSFRGLIGNFGPIEPYITLLDPGGNEALKGGSERYITWTSYGVENVRIEFSLDGGAHWQTVAESVKASEQRYLWTVPRVSSNTCRMRIIDTADNRITSEIGAFAIVNLTGVEDEQNASPRPFVTVSNHPNPFNPATTIRYELGMTGRVTLTVYNALGQLVRKHDLGQKGRGAHEFAFDGSGLPSGVYFYRVEAGSAASTGRMLLLR